MLHNSLIDGKGCSHILHDSAHIDRDSRWCRNLTTDNGINELFLTSLWIFLGKGYDFDVVS